MKKFKNVLLSLLVVSVLSGCNGFGGKDFLSRPESLVLPSAPTDSELQCLPIEVFATIITRDGSLSSRVETLEQTIDAHNNQN